MSQQNYLLITFHELAMRDYEDIGGTKIVEFVKSFLGETFYKLDSVPSRYQTSEMQTSLHGFKASLLLTSRSRHRYRSLGTNL